VGWHRGSLYEDFLVITQYHIGLVLPQGGMSDKQWTWFMAELKHRVSCLTPDPDGRPSGVNLHLPSFNVLKPDDSGGLVRIYNRPLPAQCKIQIVSCPDTSKAAHQFIMAMMVNMDEVWCMPTYGQIHALSRGRPAVIYRASQRLEPQVACKFKWIPPWVEVYQPAEKQKKGKRNGKPTIFRT